MKRPTVLAEPAMSRPEPDPPRPSPEDSPTPARSYAGRSIALASRHGKERAFGPPVMRWCDARLVVPPDLPTDRLGTFTGEVERPGPAEVVVREKARMGAVASGLRLAIATEASFGPDPAAPFIAAHHELALLLDLDTGVEIVEEIVSHKTNLAHAVLESADETMVLERFLATARFPTHGLIVRPAGAVRPGTVERDVLDRDGLSAAIDRARERSPDGRVHLETDMRAHRNPSRMEVLGELADRLMRRVATPCPACGSLGFGRVRAIPGLPCSWCGTPTFRMRATVDGCPGCGEEIERPRSDGATQADPGSCPRCNP